MTMFPVIGSVLSHGFLATGQLPDHIALPTLTALLLGPSTSVLNEVMLDTFMDFISAYKRSVFKQAFEYPKCSSYPAHLQVELKRCLLRIGCRVLPMPSKLLSIIEQTARYEFYPNLQLV